MEVEPFELENGKTMPCSRYFHRSRVSRRFPSYQQMWLVADMCGRAPATELSRLWLVKGFRGTDLGIGGNMIMDNDEAS